MIEEGEKIPSFQLEGIDKNGNEKSFNLESCLGDGDQMLLYFYPKDSTPGCTTEACDFRDSIQRLAGKISVVGVSADSIKSHVKFREKQSLNFCLLSDPEHELMEPLGAWGEKNMYGKVKMGIIRSTFLIGKNGIILKKWMNVRAKGHVDRVLKEIEKLDK